MKSAQNCGQGRGTDRQTDRQVALLYRYLLGYLVHKYMVAGRACKKTITNMVKKYFKKGQVMISGFPALYFLRKPTPPVK